MAKKNAAKSTKIDPKQQDKADLQAYLTWLRTFEQQYREGEDKLDLDPSPSLEKQQLIAQIHTAFDGVRCREEDCLLYVGMARDDYQSSYVCKELAKLEERDDWTRIPIERVAACLDSQLYLGPEATRFLLPAFMVAELSTKRLCICTGLDTWYCMEADDTSRCRERLSQLNPAQQEALSATMMFLRRAELRMAEEYYDYGEDVEFHKLLPWEWDELRAMDENLEVNEYLLVKGLYDSE